MERAEIGRRIRRARLDRHLSQNELGRRLDFSGGWVSQVERGGIGLEMAQLERIARALDVPIYDFVMGAATTGELGELLKPLEDNLTERDKEELLQIARLKAELNRKAEQQGDRSEH